MPLLYYIRHGETDWNVEARLQGRRDIPINARGRVQARLSGEILSDLLARDARAAGDLDFVASPLERTRETMELMRAAMGLTPQHYRTDDRLIEVSFGRWEGMTLPEVSARWPEAAVARERDKWDFEPPEAESYAAMSLRVRGWYDGLTSDTVAVSHGGVLRGLIVQLGIATPQEAPYMDVAQGVVFVIEPGRISRYA